MLTGGTAPRVWSLLITVFGDLARQPGDEISTGTLNHMTHAIGVRAEAGRVALHRLRKEGWLVSRRIGRTSVYSLTPWGQQQSEAASPLIYATQPLAKTAWLTMGAGGAGANEQGVLLAPGVRLTGKKPRDAEVFCTEITSDTHVPIWMKDKICARETIHQARDIEEKLMTLDRLLDAAAPLPRLEACCLRVLVVHGWRRVILKAPVLPDHVFPDDWRGPQCRAVLTRLLDRLPVTNLEDLERDVAAKAHSGSK